jgi:hypothetical protein
MDKIGSSLKGIYRDILTDRNNNVVFDSGWVKNKIVDRCRDLLAAFMKNDAEKPASGIVRLRVGEGLEAWDTDGAPVPVDSDTGLVTPHPSFTVEFDDLDLAYLNPSDVKVDGPTNRLQVTATLENNQPPPLGADHTSYPLREFGLFGEYNDGTETHEYMIDCIRHPLIAKDVNTTLVRVVRLYF